MNDSGGMCFFRKVLWYPLISYMISIWYPIWIYMRSYAYTEWFHPPGLRISPNMERETEDFWGFRDRVVAISELSLLWALLAVWSRPLRRCWAHTPPWAVETAVQSFGTWELLLSDVHPSIYRLMYYGFRPICRCDLRQAPMIDTCCMVLLRSRVATLGAMYCVRHTCWQSRTLILKI